MNKKVPEISAFFPFWNEEGNIKNVVNRAIPILERHATKWELIIVDDGSSDNTLGIAKELQKKNKQIKVVTHKPNRGYGSALKEGFLHSQYDLVVFTDGDGQFDFGELPKFLDKISNADVAIGYRKRRHDHPFRHLLMILLKIWDYMFFGFYFRDIDCGFKMFRKSAINKIMPLYSEGAMITTEILAKLIKAKLKIVEVEVNHYPRIYGDQSGGNLRVILRAIRESVVLWKNLYYGKA